MVSKLLLGKEASASLKAFNFSLEVSFPEMTNEYILNSIFP